MKYLKYKNYILNVFFILAYQYTLKNVDQFDHFISYILKKKHDYYLEENNNGLSNKDCQLNKRIKIKVLIFWTFL